MISRLLSSTAIGRSILAAASAAAARTALGLGSAAEASIGTGAGNVMAADDARVIGLPSVKLTTTTGSDGAVMTAGVVNKLIHWTENSDTAGIYASGDFTIPANGWYSISCSMFLFNAGTVRMSLCVGGTETTVFATTQGLTLAGSIQFYATTGQVISVAAIPGDAGVYVYGDAKGHLTFTTIKSGA